MKSDKGNMASVQSGTPAEQQYTPEQIRQWRAFERVRSGGRYNMFDPRARKATGLHGEDYMFVMRNYSALKARATEGESSAGSSDKAASK